MPRCHLCQRYFSPHNRQCPTCFDAHGLPRIQHQLSPVAGDTWIEPGTGAAYKILEVRVVDGRMFLELSDGSFAESELGEFSEVPLPNVVAPNA